MSLESIINILNITTFIFYTMVLYHNRIFRYIVAPYCHPTLIVKTVGYTSRSIITSIIIYYILQNIYLLNNIRYILIILGMYLNLSVYYLLGSRGVYYGREMGLYVEYINKFPLSVIPHSQYLGISMVYIGLYNIIPLSCIIVSVLGYYYMSIMENRLCDV